MNIWPLRLAFVSVVLIMLAAPAAHAAPPDGDSSADPLEIAINSTKTVKKVELATEEPAVDGLPACDMGAPVSYSIWFAFTVDSSGSYDFNTGGTVLHYDGGDDLWPLIAVFSYAQGIGYIEAACEANTGFISGLPLDPGEYRVLIGERFHELTSGSRYRLNIRARGIYGLVENYSFDDEIGPEWTIKNADTSEVFRECDTPSECGLRFDGAAKAKISQKYVIDSSKLRMVKGDLLMLRVGANATPPAGASIKYTLKVTYSDGTPNTTLKRTEKIIYTPTTGSFMILPRLILDLPTKAVKSATLAVISPDADDTFTVENVSLELYAATYARTDGALPLPPAPQP